MVGGSYSFSATAPLRPFPSSGSPGVLRNELPMSSAAEHNPGDPAPATGYYEEYGVPGNPTGRVVHVNEGEPLPGRLRGFTWRLLPAVAC